MQIENCGGGLEDGLNEELQAAARRVVAREFRAALAGRHYTDRLMCQELVEGANAGFADEASRLAKLAWVWRREGRSGWEHLERECVRQFELHASILRDPRTGLWSNGRG